MTWVGIKDGRSAVLPSYGDHAINGAGDECERMESRADASSPSGARGYCWRSRRLYRPLDSFCRPCWIAGRAPFRTGPELRWDAAPGCED